MPTDSAPPIPIVTVTESELDAWLERQGEPAAAWIRANQFEGKAGQQCRIATAEGRIERVVCGVGEGRSLYAIAPLATTLPPGRYRLDADWDEPATPLMALGFELGRYRFERYLTPAAEQPELVLPESAAAEIQALARAVALVRDLVNTPAEDMGPAHLAEALAALAAAHGAEFSQVVGRELLREGYPAIHAVGRAAEAPPRLLELRWGQPEHPLVAVIGKGVCFDTGGLDLKSADNMRLMKKDMGGAAHAFGVAQLVMERRLPVRLLVLVPAVENAVAGNAYRPGDVVATRRGLSVEIGNTAAEGRVVRADALARASEERPAVVIDFATLTGAARVALGPDLPALFANRDELADGLLEAGVKIEDPMWRLPLYAPYRELFKSPVADLCNVSSTTFAGSIVAALFLERFVGEGLEWAHLDTFAWSRTAQPGRPLGGDAQGMRAVYEYLSRRFG